MIAAFAVDVAVFFVADRISFQDDDENKEDGRKDPTYKESSEKPVSNGASPAAALLLQVKDHDSSV